MLLVYEEERQFFAGVGPVLQGFYGKLSATVPFAPYCSRTDVE